MWNIFDLTITFYQKWTEATFINFNLFWIYSNFIYFLENQIWFLLPSSIITLNIVDTITFALKFLTFIAMLIFIRGGIPRYRYDFLTKIGWIKFLSLVLAVFLTTLLLVYLM